MMHIPLGAILCIAQLSAPADHAVQPASDSSGAAGGNAAALIDSVIATQKKISSIHCAYHHKRYLNDAGPAEYQGDIDYCAPENILMHFLYPADEFVLVDDSTVLIYGVKNAYGIRYSRKCLSPPEQQIAEQIGQVKMNLLAAMRPAYGFFFSDTASAEAVVVSAVPRAGWKNLSRILLTVNRPRLFLKSVSIYGKDGALVSSTAYADFRPVADAQVYFPHLLTVTVLAAGVKQRDEIVYSAVVFNKGFQKNHFSVPVEKNAKIIDNKGDCK